MRRKTRKMNHVKEKKVGRRKNCKGIKQRGSERMRKARGRTSGENGRAQSKERKEEEKN